MPWKETNPVLERHHFAQDLESGRWTMSELCLRYGISPNTGYKWLERYRHDGPRGLPDRSRAPRSIPHQTPTSTICSAPVAFWRRSAPTTELPSPPAANLNLQQRVFNRFRTTYNQLRPHEALDDETPASLWTPSARPYPEHIARPEYPGHFEVRKVRTAGTFRLHSGQHFLSQALNN